MVCWHCTVFANENPSSGQHPTRGLAAFLFSRGHTAERKGRRQDTQQQGRLAVAGPAILPRLARPHGRVASTDGEALTVAGPAPLTSPTGALPAPDLVRSPLVYRIGHRGLRLAGASNKGHSPTRWTWRRRRSRRTAQIQSREEHPVNDCDPHHRDDNHWPHVQYT